VASGGELSRVMLALMGAGLKRSAGASALTLVLDEVDAGIGGETALAVGGAIQELGRVHQVLCVTHLAQVAGRADRHGALSKATTADRTHSRLAWVEGEPRVRELARLLSSHRTSGVNPHPQTLGLSAFIFVSICFSPRIHTRIGWDACRESDQQR
jgi:DNA repair protein RecN (Recombination protein N)